jgi:hypothetical protein
MFEPFQKLSADFHSMGKDGFEAAIRIAETKGVMNATRSWTVTLAAIPCFLILFIGIIAVALFIFHTNRKLYNDHSKSKRPPRDRGSKLKGSPRSTLKSSLLARKDALAKSWRRS